MTAASRRRRMPLRVRARARLPRVGPRGLVAIAVVIGILVGAFFWVRQSSLVAVRKVTITGVTGPDAARIRSALRGAALGMSTLDLDSRRLHRVVAAYPVVDGLRVSTHFPHGLRIDVAERVPVAVVVGGGVHTVVSAEGALLSHPPPATGPLPAISVPVVPGATSLTGAGRVDVRLLAAAPYPLLAKVATAGRTSRGDVTVTLRDGPTVVFGAASAFAAKWRALVAVLADPSSAGASYIDVTDPARPAAGAGTDGGMLGSG